jgi:serine phosphatase RsbU (regulator of sigma subunit)
MSATDSTHARFVSLRLRLLGLAALVLIPWLALVLYTQAEERRTEIAGVAADAKRLIRIVTSNQATQIEAAREVLATLVRLPPIATRDPAACNAFLAEMRGAYPMYLNLGVASRDGEMFCSGLPMTAPVSIADRPYFRAILDTRRFTIGEYQVGRVTLVPAINFAEPVLDAAGNVQAVLFAAQSLNWLGVALANIEFPPGAALVVTDRNGTVLARLPDTGDWVGKTLPEPRVLAAFASAPQGSVFEADDAEGQGRLWAHAPLIAGHDLHAAIGVSKDVAFADIDRRFRRNLVALALATVAALAAAWFGARPLLRQVDALVDATTQLAAGDLGARASVVGSRSELDFLARAFNTMASTLEARDKALRIAEEKTRTAEVELAVTRAHMEVAQQIQRSLLPEHPLKLAGVRFAGRCIPMAAVGGDYFGFFPRAGNGVDSFVGDVSGHGVGAALLMAEARTTFLAERLVEPNPAQILARLNDLLHEDLDRAELFITACCATFDGVTRELHYANAGHPPALLLRAGDARCTPLVADGMVLGYAKDVHFAELTIPLHGQDIVVFYTDGITETRNEADELFGVARLGDAIVAHRDEEPEALVAGVLAALERYTGAAPRDDDLTLVVMKLTD